MVRSGCRVICCGNCWCRLTLPLAAQRINKRQGGTPSTFLGPPRDWTTHLGSNTGVHWRSGPYGIGTSSSPKYWGLATGLCRGRGRCLPWRGTTCCLASTVQKLSLPWTATTKPISTSKWFTLLTLCDAAGNVSTKVAPCACDSQQTIAALTAAVCCVLVQGHPLALPLNDQCPQVVRLLSLPCRVVVHHVRAELMLLVTRWLWHRVLDPTHSMYLRKRAEKLWTAARPATVRCALMGHFYTTWLCHSVVDGAGFA